MSSQTYGIVTTEATLAVIGKTYHRKYLKMMFNSKVNIQNNTVKSIFWIKYFENFVKTIFRKFLEKIWKRFFFLTKSILSSSFFFEFYCMHWKSSSIWILRIKVIWKQLFCLILRFRFIKKSFDVYVTLYLRCFP